ncbi:MAG TPA: hypothetical protein VFA45_22515 [Actinomycetes bacterium]|jgi:hypothetical protein|nr:hypothetical protein [Actinomycetes bacterium]
MRLSTTVVALVGERAPDCLEGLRQAANVRVVRPNPDDAPLERAAAAYRAAGGTHVPYLAHDADPLGPVAEAWVRWFDQRGPAGELEVTVRETLARWRADSIALPDYYLVLDADAWEATRRHWYLGFLHRAAPSRVVPAAGTAGAVATELSRLASGRWWPHLDRMLAEVDKVVPDRV